MRKRTSSSLHPIDLSLLLQSDLLRYITDSVIVTDLRGKIIYWNKGASKIFGYSAEEIMGETLTLLYPQLHGKHLESDLKRIRAGQDFVGLWEGRRKDGNPVWVNIKTSLLRDKTKKPIGFLGIAADITEQKRLSEELSARVKQQEAVAELGQYALTGAPLKDIFLFATIHLCKVLDVELAEILELLPTENKFIFRRGVGWEKSYVDKKTVPALEGSQAAYTLSIKKPVVVKDLATDTRFHSVLLRQHKIVSGMSTVLWKGGVPWGVVGVHSKKSHSFTKHDTNFLQVIASVLSQVIERRYAEADQYRLAAIIASSDDAIVSKTLNGIITSWNSAAERMFGYKAEEAIGKPITLIIPPHLRYEEKRIIRRLRQGKRIDHFETTRVRKDGRELIISLSVSPIKNRVGEVIGASKIARDITAQKRMDEYLQISEERFRLLVENAQDFAIFHLDGKGLVTSWNIGAERVFGYKEEEIIGKHFSVFFTPEDQKQGKPKTELAAAAKKGSASDDNWALQKGGERFWASGVTTAIKDVKGKLIGFAKIVRDQTEQKRQEQRKDEFISMASHELKTPITSMKLFLEILQNQVRAYHDPKAETYIERLKDQADKLRELVADLLDVSRIETGKLSFHKEQLRLDLLVSDTVEALRPTSPRHVITIEKAEEVFVVADRFRIYQVVTNLVMNAIKYSPKADKIIVRIERNHEKALVSVADFGIGIAKEQQDKIFEKLYQVSGRTENTYPGLGMGLYISKEIIQRHHGTIGVKSEKGKGATFFFSLPLLEKV